MAESVNVIGAGLVGCLAAIALAKRDFEVTLFDYRQDPRLETTKDRNLRSINLAISARGITSLEFVDEQISQRVLKNMIPMRGRMIHDLAGNQESQDYGLFGECINSIDRSVLNNNLLDEVDRFSNIHVKFGHKLSRVDFSREKQTCVFTTDAKEQKSYDADFVVGCDGAYSTTRSQMQREVRMDYSQEYIDCCYIELYIPPAETQDATFGSFVMSPNHLHIWPRHNFMLIALANGDGSFTSTFFGPWSLVESLDSRTKIEEFLKCNFSDALDVMGHKNAVDAFERNPRGALMCVECKPYHVDQGRAIILGDAAHSMVPFYGQGMNCGFEDVKVLMRLLDAHPQDRAAVFAEYSLNRHEDLVSIIKLAKDNYKEMSHGVTSRLYLIRKKLDTLLGKWLKDKWLPLYTMVSFKADIPYHKAILTEQRQKRILAYIQAVILATLPIGGLGLYKIIRKTLKNYRK
ncbi:LAME_0F11958g1_1 [Lachancea meyersii CBS 8951]|uniref:Kynurenine 3-monooxygenase n=1 Tax=Lachancea meyersii CBS 8951 TaxID=1266667 RepID=A0A1G4JWC5_9SACH|nr:LAME_0F11958g1_1 [Lachancea meyersii CBS 8951]